MIDAHEINLSVSASILSSIAADNNVIKNYYWVSFEILTCDWYTIGVGVENIWKIYIQIETFKNPYTIKTESEIKKLERAMDAASSGR
jgi:hypothetical protein